MRHLRQAFAVLILLGAVTPLAAQSPGTLSGRIVDSAGAGVPAVVVTASSSKAAVTALTDFAGRYELPPLPPGRYEVAFQAVGSARDEHATVRVEAGLATMLEARAAPAVQKTNRAISKEATAFTNGFGFMGAEQDGETGLYYLQARYYDPELGRFISEDPSPGTPEIPPSLHPYLYAYANPTVYYDPTGTTTLVVGSNGESHEVPDDGRVLYANLVEGGYSPNAASKVVIDSGLGEDIGADRSKALEGPIAAAGELTKYLLATSYGAGLSGGLVAAVAPATLGATGTALLSDTVAGLGGQAGADLARGDISSARDYARAGAGALVLGQAGRMIGGALGASESVASVSAGPNRNMPHVVGESADGGVSLHADGPTPTPPLDAPSIRSATVQVAAEAKAAEVEILFRGDRSSLDPQVVFKEGFAPKGENTSLREHTETNGANSIYVSTSRDLDVAREFAQKNGYVYVIHSARGVDAGKALGQAYGYAEQAEVAIPGGVKPSEIVGAYKVRRFELTNEFLPNPNYKP